MPKSQTTDLSAPVTASPERPLCDEWGVYDPEQAGFEAVLRRLMPDEDDPGISVAPPGAAPVRVP